jgi:tetratricopeptide (TPR) repeat protein
LLEREAATVRSTGNGSDAGHLAAHLAIACFAAGDLPGATAAHRQAISDDPTNYFHREHLARFLLCEANDPAGALSELDEAAPLMPTDLPTLHHNFNGLRASILFALGRVDEAITAFRKVNDAAMVTRMDSRGLELDIARRLCRGGIALPEVQSYLRLVLTQAERSADKSTRSAVTSLLAEFGNH